MTDSKKPRLLTRPAGVALLAILALACGSTRPVLYPNDLYEEVGEYAAEEDVTHCIELAESNGLPTEKQGSEAAEGAAKGSLAGAIVGGAVGWVLGNPGKGAAAGAAGGGTRGGMSGYAGSGDADPLYRRFVETCLREKGYQPIGWK